MDRSHTQVLRFLSELNEIGIALSAEKNHNRLLELILVKAMELTNADAGTLYLHTEDNKLKFEIMHNRSLNIHKGGNSGEEISFYPISIYDKDGKPNNYMVSAWSVVNRQTMNIPDAYTNAEFDFSGTRSFDKKTNYRSKSFLTVPMTDHENDIIGVLQLINAMEENTQNIIPFSPVDEQLVKSLASQAAVTITNKKLLAAQKNLFDALIKLIADAIDEKSAYTAGHCRRVPIITTMITNATNKIDKGPLKDFYLDDEQKYELEVAAWLHDCGKITTPEYVVDKGTKLETIFDRIKLVDTRFEIIKRDMLITALKEKMAEDNHSRNVDIELENDTSLQEKLNILKTEKDILHSCNIGTETITDENLAAIDKIASRKYQDMDGENTHLLNEKEIENLKIQRGTLLNEERQIINNHVSVTIKMLESLPYPKYLKHIPEYAGGHHEKIDGTGYPNKLTGEQMPLQSRILAIADIFEALTAADRPYKKAMPLSRALKILGQMKIDKHIDGDLFDVFINEKVYLDYAKTYLPKEQIDTISYDEIPGYRELN